MKIDKTGADLLFQIISHRYGKGSLIVTTNRVFKDWSEIFNNDSTLTSALLDRLLHHTETVVIEGDSYRMKEIMEIAFVGFYQVPRGVVIFCHDVFRRQNLLPLQVNGANIKGFFRSAEPVSIGKDTRRIFIVAVGIKGNAPPLCYLSVSVTRCLA